jgi:hypothetical protein
MIFLSLFVTAALLSGCHEAEPQQANAFVPMPSDMTNNLYPSSPAPDSKPAAAPVAGPATGK